MLSEQTRVLKTYESFILGTCQCPCSTELPNLISKRQRSDKIGFLRRYIHRHNFIGKIKKRILMDEDGYILIYRPEHPYCNINGWIREHRLIMEQHLGRYLTRIEVVHHINKNKYDNRIENLMLFNNQKEHLSYELTKDMSNRICIICSTNKTYVRRENNRPHWYKYKYGFICRKCYRKTKKILLLTSSNSYAYFNGFATHHGSGGSIRKSGEGAHCATGTRIK